VGRRGGREKTEGEVRRGKGSSGGWEGERKREGRWGERR